MPLINAVDPEAPARVSDGLPPPHFTVSADHKLAKDLRLTPSSKLLIAQPSQGSMELTGRIVLAPIITHSNGLALNVILLQAISPHHCNLLLLLFTLVCWPSCCHSMATASRSSSPNSVTNHLQRPSTWPTRRLWCRAASAYVCGTAALSFPDGHLQT